MVFNNEEFRKSFQSLSTRYGGSLLLEKQLLPQEEVVVFIGLGGLGGRAVNAIKAAATEKLSNPDRRFFLTVDTCEKDMNDISAVTKIDIEDPDEAEFRVRGCIEEHEKLPLYKDTYKIKTLGHDIDSWLNRAQLGEVEVDNRGAQGIRQIGRVMLMANGNYEIVYRKLSTVLNNAKNVAVNKNVEMKIYIIAGISGGTGSGTIVDFTYMVKRAISGFAPKYKKIDAILFTPDVQFNDHGIDQNKQKGLKANFYAAIKEVDFFFNNKARKVSYKCPYTNDEEVYKEDIFDSCTLVSRRAQGIDVSSTSNGVIKKIADALTFEISGITGKTNQGDGQSYSAFFSNVYNNFQLWWPANSNGNGLDMPDWAPSRYSSLAYSSFYIPRDELIAYCANRLMERLADHWKQSDITEEELKGIFRKYHIASNKAFAGTIFNLSNCAEMFDVEKSELPVDGFGPVKVKNCVSYLDLMRSTAEQEGTTQRAKGLLKIARQKQNVTFVDPIISLVDKAFTTDGKGPVYAINLLSAGVSREYNDKSGILAWLKKLITDLPDDVQTWSLELEQVHDALSAKAEKYDGLLSIDTNDLESFTNDCRQYGEDLLKCKLLAQSSDYLIEIFDKLNEKNDRVFQIYTYAFEYLITMLKKDSEYVTNTDRHREGQTTIFSFDLTDFQENEKNSKRFKLFFESVVDTKNLDKESKAFVSIIFGRLKELLDPATPTAESGVVQPGDVIEIIRDYFKTSFADFTTDVIEQFCVVAYSDVEATAERITEIWNDPQKKAHALKKAADAINAKIISQRNIMLTCADVSRDLQNFCSYETFAALPDTPNINSDLGNPFILQANWSEYIGFKRIFGFPINLLADMDEYKKEYDAQAITAGIHLDEMYSADDGFGDWRYALPEPYSYPTAKFLRKYTEGGKDTSEKDKQHMKTLLELAIKAKELGLLVEKTNDNSDANRDDIFFAENGQTYYELIWKLISEIGDFDGKKSEIYTNIRKAVSSFIEEKRNLDFFEILNRAGYRPAEASPIQWNFVRPEFNVMQQRTNMGDDVNFGNFIILLRSNPYWGVQLKKGVELFGKLHNIYETVLDEFAAADKYNERIINFMRAIRVGRIIPFYDAGLFTGYRIKVSEKSEDDIIFVNGGLDAFDQKFLIYHCFTEVYVNLEPGKYVSMNTLVKRDFDIEKRIDYSKEARENVYWFIRQADKVIKDEELLAHYDPETMKKKFREKLRYSKFAYSLPSPSKNKEDVESIIDNLKGFYTELRDHLKENIPSDDVVHSTEAAKSSASVTARETTDTWTCSCGTSNSGKFCQGCGKQKPAPAGNWTCSCGTSNTGNFCQNCGEKKPVISGAWQCSCGAMNKGNFCQNCGNKQPTTVKCSNCGWQPDEGTVSGKFCPMCGTALN